MFSPLNGLARHQAMFRGVASALIAMAAFDLYVLDGRYIRAFQSIGLSVLHFFGF